MTEYIGLYLQGLVLAFAWMEIQHRAIDGLKTRSENRKLDSVLAGIVPYALFVLLMLLARPDSGLNSGLAIASLVLLGGLIAEKVLRPSWIVELAVELVAYGVLIYHGLAIHFAHVPTGTLVYFKFGAPVITCLWLFAFSRILRLGTTLPGLFEGMLALLSYLFLGSFYLHRQSVVGIYGVVLVFAGVTTGLWFFTYRSGARSMGSVAASCWGMAAGALSVVGTSKRLAVLSIVPPAMALLAPDFFFSYIVVWSYLVPKISARRMGRFAFQWNINRESLVTLLLLFSLVGNLVVLAGFLSGDPFLVLGPGVFSIVLLWRLLTHILRVSTTVPGHGERTRTINILGVDVWAGTEAELVGQLTAFIRDGRQHIIVTPDSLALYRSLHDEDYRRILAHADICVPDGAGVVWAGDFLYESPILSRIPGVDLVDRLLAVARARDFSVFFLGASPSVIERAGREAQLRHPGLKVAVHHGFFTTEDEPALIEEINQLAPDLIFVGLGVPKQEHWIARNLPRLKTSLMMGVGGTFDVLSGEKNRAPTWLQNCGLEWLYRVACEPHRFTRIMYLPFFVVEVLREKLQEGLDAPSQRP
jgi:N-acetylglucosaminyldiphosphoundecaprenol N-acetyl-beta-D-mannosaminyltransferase